MKAIIRIPTKEYAYIELEVEGTPEQIFEEHQAWINRVKDKEGIPEKEFNAFVDRQLMGEENHVEEYQKMSPEQQKYVQAIKRSLKRIEARQIKSKE